MTNEKGLGAHGSNWATQATSRAAEHLVGVDTLAQVQVQLGNQALTQLRELFSHLDDAEFKKKIIELVEQGKIKLQVKVEE